MTNLSLNKEQLQEKVSELEGRCLHFQETIADLERALIFYADESRYNLDTNKWVTAWEDKGKTAKRALGRLAIDIPRYLP